MKTRLHIFSFALLFLFTKFGYTQVTFWTEDFGTQDCTSRGTVVTSYTTGPNGPWTETVFTAASKANKWFVSSTEAGFPAGTCSDGCINTPSLTNKTLHVGSQQALLMCSAPGDCGAAYNATGANNVTDKRAESPAINCAPYSNITLSFNYIEDGQGLLDDATVWYFDGSTWAQIANPVKSNNSSCGGQGLWTAFTIALPVSANNNANVKIGFRWVNNGDGVGTDPSFAVDDIILQHPSGGPVPGVNFTVNDTTLCVGQCVNFNDTCTNNPTSWAWSFPGATPDTSNNPNPSNICYNIPGTYAVTLSATNSNGTGVRTKTGYIVVTANPVVTVSPASTTICPGGSDSLVASGATTYAWSPGTGLNTTSGPIVIASPTTPQTYVVTGTTNGCSDTASTSVIISGNLNITITPPSMTICNGSSDTLTASGASTFTWSPGTWLNSTTGAMVIVSPTTVTSHTYTVTGTSGGCTGSTTITVTSTNGLVAEAGPNVAVCSGGSAQLNASGGSNYSWFPITGLSNANIANPMASPTVTTTYTLTVTSGSCPSASDIVTVTVNNNPTASITGTDSVCPGAPISLIATGGTSYHWNNNATDSIITVNPIVQTTYTVTVTSLGCTDDATFTINVYIPAAVNASADITSIKPGETAHLNASGGMVWTWTPSAGLSCTGCQNPVATPDITTTYTVLAMDTNGCHSMDTITIWVKIECGSVYIPNVFSPNSDNNNDILYVRGNCIASMEFVIFDRWGEKVFTSSSTENGWNGNFRGKPVDAGVFVYNLKATLTDNSKIKRKGNITIIR